MKIALIVVGIVALVIFVGFVLLALSTPDEDGWDGTDE